MGVLGVRPDLGACLAGDDEACERTYFASYLWTRLQKELEKMRLAEFPPVILPFPRPDPPPYEYLRELAAGHPQSDVRRTQPTAQHPRDTAQHPRDIHVSALSRLLEGLESFSKEIEAEKNALTGTSKGRRAG